MDEVPKLSSFDSRNFIIYCKSENSKIINESRFPVNLY